MTDKEKKLQAIFDDPMFEELTRLTEKKIREAINAGYTVRWNSDAYKVVIHFDNLYIKAFNGNMTPLAGDVENCYIEKKVELRPLKDNQ